MLNVNIKHQSSVFKLTGVGNIPSFFPLFTIVDIGLTLLAQASMDLNFLWEAYTSGVFLLNRLPSPILNQYSSPFELLFGFKPD